MDIPVVSGLAGAIVGAMTTVCVYQFILKRRVDKLRAQRSITVNKLGDPISQYLALLVYQMKGAYQRLEGKETDQAKTTLSEILASYSSFVTSNRHRSQSEQDTLDAIREACSKSETLRRIVDEQVNIVKDKTVDQLLEEMEKELANYTSEGIRQPADGSPKPSM